MITTSSSDQELLEAVRDRQNKTAFEFIVRRYEEKVFGLCFRIINSREEAEDIAQEVFIKLWEQPDDWQPAAKIFHLAVQGDDKSLSKPLAFFEIQILSTVHLRIR